MSWADEHPFSEEGQLLFLGRLARRHKTQSYEVVVLRQGGFDEKTVELAKQLLDAVLRCGWSGSPPLPPLLRFKLCQAIQTFTFFGLAEMGRNFYVQVLNADNKVRGVRDMLVMARYKGLAPLQQLAMGCVASCVGEQMDKVDTVKDKVDTDKVDKDKVDKEKVGKDRVDLVGKEKLQELEIPLHFKKELQNFI